MTTDMAAVSERALDRIKSHGWVKHVTAPFGAAGPMCLSATLTHLLTGEIGLTHARDWTAYRETAMIIQEQFPYRFPDIYARFCRPDSIIVHFNDHPDTTLADVIAVLEKLGTRDA